MPIPIWGSAAAPGDIVEPSNSQIASGIVRVGNPAIPQKLSYQWFNWLMNQITALLNGASVTFWGGNDTGTANHYALTIAGFPTNANISPGTIIQYLPKNSNTGSCDVAINGQAPIGIAFCNGILLTPTGVTNAIMGGSFPQTATLQFDGTYWRLMSPGFGASFANFAVFTGGDVNAEGFAATGVRSDSPIGTDQNNYSVSGFSGVAHNVGCIEFDPTASVNITGIIPASVIGTIIVFYNGGTNNMTLKSQSASSAAANRFQTASDVVIAPGMSVMAYYNGQLSRWNIMGY